MNFSVLEAFDSIKRMYFSPFLGVKFQIILFKEFPFDNDNTKKKHLGKGGINLTNKNWIN